MRIEHITINTKDLEESIKFYEEVIKLKIKLDFRNEGGMPIVFLADSDDGACIELIENKEQPYSGAGLSIGFHVEDVEVTHKEFISRGLEPTPIISPNPNVKFFFVKDPNGVMIQFI